MDVAMLRKSANLAPERTQEGRIVNLGQQCAEDGQLVAPLLENTLPAARLDALSLVYRTDAAWRANSIAVTVPTTLRISSLNRRALDAMAQALLV